MYFDQESIHDLLTPWPDEDNRLPVGCSVMIVVGVLFVGSAFWAFTDLRYLLFGETTSAAVTSSGEHADDDGYPYRKVSYRFTDVATGEVRSESDEVPLSWPAPGATAEIVYLPDDQPFSRLAGHYSTWSLLFFFACTAIAIGYVVLLWIEARKAVAVSEMADRARQKDREEAQNS